MDSEEDESMCASLNEPLVAPSRIPKPPERPIGVGIPGGVLNLVKCILGAGLLSIPKAFSLLGAVLGTGLFGLVSVLTVLTVEHGLVNPSTTPDGSTLLLPTYSSAVYHWVGGTAEQLLSMMMMIGMLGFEASYLDIIADVLLGSKANPGLLSAAVSHFCSCDVFPPTKQPDPRPPCDSTTPRALLFTNPSLTHGLHGGVDVAVQGVDNADTGTVPSWVWLLDRRLVLAGVVCLVLLPLSLRRHMGSLSAVNAVGLMCLGAFLLSLMWLAVAAVVADSAHPLPLLPDFEQLGSTVGTQALTAFGVLSVLLTANGCHANMHPLMGIIQPFSRQRTRRVTIITITITTSYYWLVSVCAYIVWGQDIQDDILTNLSPGDMKRLVGPWLAHAMSLMLRAGYVVSIMGSALLTMFPLRQAVFDLFLGPVKAEPRARYEHFIPRTYSQDKQAALGQAAAQADNGNTIPIYPNQPYIFNHQLTQPPPYDPPQITPNRVSFAGTSTSEPGALLQEQSHASGFSDQDIAYRVSDVSARGSHVGLLSRQGTGQLQVRNQLHGPLSVVLFGLAYLLAVTVPSIWVVVSLVGSCSATFLSFIMPATIGLYALRQLRPSRLTGYCIKAVLRSASLLGVLIFINGFLTLYLRNQAGSKGDPGAD